MQFDPLSSVGALAEPARRALYDYVATQPDAVSREQAADAVGLAVHSAKFHLEKLVAAGLLEVEFRRLSGRSGPGAGRPAKLYRRSPQEVAVTLPERRYDLAGEVLAEAVDRSARGGTPIGTAVQQVAAETGRALAVAPRDAGRAIGCANERLCRVLAHNGYEPRADGDDVVLANCPFDQLAGRHTSLVCGMNLALIGGVLEGLGATELSARLAPEPGFCCVRVGP